MTDPSQPDLRSPEATSVGRSRRRRMLGWLLIFAGVPLGPLAVGGIQAVFHPFGYSLALMPLALSGLPVFATTMIVLFVRSPRPTGVPRIERAERARGDERPPSGS